MVSWANNIHTPDFLTKHRHWRFRDETMRVLAPILNLNKHSSLIEIGCGTGVLCERIKELNPFVDVSGFDIDYDFIDYAKRDNSKCRFIQADARTIKEDISYDYVLSHTIMEYMDENIFFDCNRRLISPTGELIIMSITPQTIHHPMLWEPQISQIHFNKTINSDLTKLIQPQGYDETNIIEKFRKHNFNILSIDYIISVSDLTQMDIEEKMIFKDVLKYYQLNKYLTSQESCQKDKILEFSNMVASYYDDLFNNNKLKRFVDIEIIRVIKACLKK